MRVIARKGGVIYLKDGHQYFNHKQYKNGTFIVRCAKYRRERCTGSLTVSKDSKQVLRSRIHTCKPDYVANETALRIDNCKKLATSTSLPIAIIYNKAIAEAAHVAMPSFDNFKHALYNARRKAKKSGIS